MPIKSHRHVCVNPFFLEGSSLEPTLDRWKVKSLGGKGRRERGVRRKGRKWDGTEGNANETKGEGEGERKGR